VVLVEQDADGQVTIRLDAVTARKVGGELWEVVMALGWKSQGTALVVLHAAMKRVGLG